MLLTRLQVCGALTWNLYQDDSTVIYYVSAIIVRSSVSTTKCVYYRKSLISQRQLETVEFEDVSPCSSSAADFIDIINKGGLHG
jgi:hypothetical protein